jgi:hypothetical protein
MVRSGSLTVKQDLALDTLMKQPSIEDAAILAKVGTRTLYRWLSHNEAFRAAYLASRRQAMSQTITQLQQVTVSAVRCLSSIMVDDTQPSSSRVSAARTVLEMALRGLELEDLEAQIATLEGRAAQNTNRRYHR